MEVKDIIKEGRPAEFKFEGKYTFAELVSLATDNCYKTGVHDGYEYALEEFEHNRLKACESQTEAESERELNFAIKFFEEHHRQPTFSDAIEETRKQMIEKATKWIDDNAFEYVKTETVGIMENYKRFESERMIEDLKKAMEESV